MESLLFLFETVSSVGSVLGRSDEKTQELLSMIGQVKSVSESVKSFAASIPEEERDEVFNSNQVWRQIWEQVKSCEQVISKHADRLRAANGVEQQAQPGAQSTSAALSLRRSACGVARTSRSLLSEAFEALGSALGENVASVLRLPEDELSKIRQASKEMEKLLPTLQLAISVYAMKGTKRRAPPAEEPRPLQARRLSDRSAASAGFRSSDDNALSSRGSEAALTAGEMGSPHDKLLLQLVSDDPRARSLGDLPVLTTQDLRLAGNIASTSSLDNAGGEPTVNGSTASSENHRYLLGRSELKDKIPKNLSFPCSPNSAPVHLTRYISRDAIALDVPTVSTDLLSSTGSQDVLDKATLALGEVCSPGCDDATLPWGCGTDDIALLSTPRALAYVTGLIKKGEKEGVHLQRAGETRWRWIGKGVQEEICSGDRIALIMESPPGSKEPGPPEDLDTHEVVCLLGLELQQQL